VNGLVECSPPFGSELSIRAHLDNLSTYADDEDALTVVNVATSPARNAESPRDPPACQVGRSGGSPRDIRRRVPPGPARSKT